MSSFGSTLLISLAALTMGGVLLWLVSLARRDASIVDPAWGMGFVLTAWLAVWWNWPASPHSLLLAVLTTVWGFRLSMFLLWRNWNQGEDRRYTAMRQHHGPRFWWLSLFSVFLLQSVVLWFVAWPLQVIATTAAGIPWGWLDAIGILIWSVGFLFETVGDFQLARFKAEPSNAGRVMDRGLWRYTRHPNYFGDFCVWWGVYLVAAAGGGWWVLESPLLMSILLLRVSGVTLLEKTINQRRPEYAAYQARTSSFFPWRPRSR